MLNKCDEAETYIGEQNHPGIRILVDSVVGKYTVKSPMDRSEIVPPDFVAEYFGARFPSSRYEKIHKSNGG
jgi:hypothetical protein